MAATSGPGAAIADLNGCPVCGAKESLGFLRRASMPVHQNLLFADAASARAAPRGDLDMAVCEGCGFIWNRSFDAGRLRYGAGYENTQAHSAAFRAHVEQLANHLLVELDLRGRRILEIGCGDGSFLERLVRDPAAANRGWGFDPSYRGPAESTSGRAVFKARYYGPEWSSLPADLVVCRHVVEHVARPVELLGLAARAISDSEHPLLALETPDAAWILEHVIFWDFFYEHCSLFTAGSLAAACARAGLGETRSKRVFGDQYLWLECLPGQAAGPTDGKRVVALASSYASAEAARLDQWVAQLQRAAASGPVAVWGAGAKGVTFANLVDGDASRIDCLVDLNRAKQWHYVAGTGHPIVGPDQLAGRGIRTVLVLNPNYADEIRSQAAQAVPGVRLVVAGDTT